MNDESKRGKYTQNDEKEKKKAKKNTKKMNTKSKKKNETNAKQNRAKKWFEKRFYKKWISVDVILRQMATFRTFLMWERVFIGVISLDSCLMARETIIKQKTTSNDRKRLVNWLY